MTTDLEDLSELFRSLARDPASLPAFERYARAVEELLEEEGPEELAETLADHLDLLPGLAESRLESRLDAVSRSLLESQELGPLRRAQRLDAALAGARRSLETRHPRIRGRSPEEFVRRVRQQPRKVLEYLEEVPVDWAEPELARVRAALLRLQELPGSPEADTAAAAALAELGDRLETGAIHPFAEVAYRAALRFDPGQVQARAGLGTLALTSGRLGEAHLELQAALDRDPHHARSLAGLAELHLDRGHVAAAKELVARLLACQPHLPQGLMLAGSIDLYEGDLVGALSNLLEAALLDPDHPRTFVLLAESYARAGHPALAERHLAAARLRLGPDHPPPRVSPPGPEPFPLDPFLLQPPPDPPRLRTPPGSRAGGNELQGPLGREEALRVLLTHTLVGSSEDLEVMGLALRARQRLRVPRDRFLRLYDEIREDREPPPGETPPVFDPIETFEELRRRAWRDGFLSPEERDLLEESIALLGIERRGQPRPRPD